MAHSVRFFRHEKDGDFPMDFSSSLCEKLPEGMENHHF